MQFWWIVAGIVAILAMVFCTDAGSRRLQQQTSQKRLLKFRDRRETSRLDAIIATGSSSINTLDDEELEGSSGLSRITLGDRRTAPGATYVVSGIATPATFPPPPPTVVAGAPAPVPDPVLSQPGGAGTAVVVSLPAGYTQRVDLELWLGGVYSFGFWLSGARPAVDLGTVPPGTVVQALLRQGTAASAVVSYTAV